MTTPEHDEVRLCETCRVIVVFDADMAGWTHPLQFREKFSDHVCQLPLPGRLARPAEAEWGRGRTFSRDRLAVFGSIAELEQAPNTPLTVGVDGSYKLVTTSGLVRKPMSWAYLTTGGTYGFGTSTIPGSVVGYKRPLQGELRAAWWSIKRTPETHPLTLLVDSYVAVELMNEWRDGGERMPLGYTLERSSGRKATLLQLAHKLHAARDRVKVEHILGHTGIPLNEAADALAKMARAWATGRLTKAEVAADARRVVLSGLLRHAAAL